MGLFNRFHETVFLKKDSDLDQRIVACRNALELEPNNNNLAKELHLLELGLKGEKEIEFELMNANIGMYVLHDVNLQCDNLKAQIDYVVVTPAKTYFIECKNLIGNITVRNGNEFIREYRFNGKTIKEGMYSPVTQAQRHIEVFKKIWLKRNTSFIDSVRYKYLDEQFVPLVVTANAKNILNLRFANKDVRSKLLKSDTLIAYLKNDIQETKKSLDATLLSQKQMQSIAQSIFENYNVPIERDYESMYRKNNPEGEVRTDLQEQLIMFRKTRSFEKNIPAYYVFTNAELEQLLQIKPKSIEELKNAGILPLVKVNAHGAEIIRIMNQNMYK